MSYTIGVLIALIIVATQYFLSRTENAYFGGIIPLVYVVSIFILWQQEYGLNDITNGEFLRVIILGTIILLSIWANGRSSLKSKRERELNQMKTMDMK